MKWPKSDNSEEKVIFKLRKSWKAFLLEYSCSLFLLLVLAYSYIVGLSLPRQIVYFILLLALSILASAEWFRRYTRYDITQSKIIVIRGFLKQTRKNVYFHSLAYVPDINMHQTIIQRFLNYGKVYIHGGGLAEALEINDIDNPQEVLRQIERLTIHTRK